MKEYNITDVKKNFNKICETLDRNEEDEILIMYHNKPIAKMVPYKKDGLKRVVGCLKDKYDFNDVDWFDNSITEAILENN